MAQQLLAPITQIADQRQKTEAYKGALQQILDSAQVDACKEFVSHMLSDDVPLVISRQLLLLYAQGVAKLPSATHVAVATAGRGERWNWVLSGIDLEGGGRAVEPGYRLRQNIKIAMLYLEDERSSRLEVYPFLQKVYLERILDRPEVEAFAKGLKPHQLGGLLGVSAEAAEAIAADMVAEGRMAGSIDQVEVEALLRWDESIRAACGKVVDLLDSVAALGLAGARCVRGVWGE
eukprot:XP_001697367.1 predicted protein [Chlamydomonas reinhardtii]